MSNDKYEITFDRPGCMQSSDMYCCMSGDSCTRYARTYDQSKAAEIVRGTDFNEGRAFFTPGSVDKCTENGEGQYGAVFSSCQTAAATAGVKRPASWSTGTKNQNMGLQGIPIPKPFVKDYYMGSIPRICSSATLTVEAHGDLADAKDNIMVYGEDDVYLGTIFAGNLTYLKEGHRAYDAYGAHTQCSGDLHDPAIAGSGDKARLADPHHPLGYIPQHKGYRGGPNVSPGVQGSEDTRCTNWQAGGKQPLSLQHSESAPYVDSIAISQDRMMQYSADGQIKFTFRSVRDDSAANSFSGTGGGGATRFCNFDTAANPALEGCDLDGKVMFRSIKLKFSAGVCFTKAAATDYSFEYLPQIHTPQNLNISISYSVPSGDVGQPGGDAAFSVTAGADIFGTDRKLVVYDKDLNKVGELFARESFQSLRSHVTDDKMVMTSSFGATDAPKPFHATTNCDTTSPILGSDVCTPADNQWGMKDTLINYTDTLRIPRENIAKMAVNGKVQLYVTADVPANAFSLSSAGKARFSPITLAYPLMHCFMKAIKTGPNFGIFLDRPMSYYFTETGFPMPAGDVTVFVAASWQQHVRYVTRHVGAAVSNKFAYDGVEDGLPVMRVDKDTVADMGSVWVYKNSDGQECCPSTHKPTAATGMHQVSGYSNCMGTSACTDPHLSTVDASTETNPCPTAQAAASLTGTLVGTTTNLNGPDGTYVGLKIILYAPLKGGAASTEAITVTTAAETYGKTAADKVFPLKISCPAATPDCGGGAVCTYKDVDGTAGNAEITCSAVGAYTTVPVVRFPDYESPEWIAGCAAIGADCDVTTNPTFFKYDATLGTKICKDADCTSYAAPVFTAVLEDGDTKGALGTTPGTDNVRTIVGYVASDFTFTVKTDWAAAPTDKNLYRISADGITAWARNGRDGGSATGAVAVPLDTASISCSTRPLHSGVIEANVGDKPDTAMGMVRLDASSSTFDTAYNDFKIKIRKKDAGWHTTTVSAYSGTIAGRIAEDQGVTLAGAVTFKLNAATAKKVVTAAPAAAGTPTASADGSAIDVAYMLDNTAANDWFNGAKIEVDIDGDASTSDDIYVRTIKDYTATDHVVTVATPFVRKSVVSGKTARKSDGTGATTTILYIYDGTDAASKQWSSSEVATTDDAYKGMFLLIDLDGYPGTIDDIELQEINAYVGSTGKLTLAAALSAAPQKYSTWTIIEKLADLDYATTGSTFRIYAREAVLAAKITGLPTAAFDSKTIGAAASAGATQVTLDAAYQNNADDYAFYKLRISENGVTDEYSIRQYKADKTASIQPPAVRAYSAAATTVVLPTFEIYQDLGTSCLENTNMTVVYSYGTAREVSNDPGELSTIYSNWDAALARSSEAEQRDVRAWTLKLNGEGYYSDLYPGEGLGGYDKNALRASGAQTNRLKTDAQVAATAKQIELVDSTAGLQVGGYLKLAKKDGTQQEIVKVTGIVDGTKITVDRGALGSNAETWAADGGVANDMVFVYQAGFNRGQGMDEMAELGGVSRYSSPANDAYTGLLVSIVAGTGAGQTRWISDYHGDSRTVYVGGSPWGVVPDATSKYKIYYSSEVVEYHSGAKLAVATYPRPVKQGYLVEFAWYECARDVPASFLNNAWTDSLTADGVLDENYGANQAVSGLPECKGSLGMRKPKQGPAHVYPRAKVLQTDYVAGLLTADGTSPHTHITLDSQAATEPGAYVGRKIQVLQGKAHCYVDTSVTANLHATTIGTGTAAGVFGDQHTLILADAAALTTLTNGGLVAGSFIKVHAQEYMQVVGIAVGTFTLTVNRMVTPPGGCLTQTASTPAAGNEVLLVIPAPVRGVATITASFLGASAVEVYLDQAITGTKTNDAYTIFPAPGVSGRTTVGEVGQNGEQYYVEEIDVVRQEYPELIEQHREWPHGYSYLQMKAGHDGQHVGNLFLKDYTQYSTESYYTDSITIPKSVFETYVRGQPNGVSGEFPFTIKTPPGSGNIELLSIVIGYPVVKEEDASSYDSTDIETKRTASHGPPPFYPYSEGWSGADAKTRTARTHPRFQTHAYTSTCGNGVHDAGEYCDDGNQADGDGCSSSCALEAGWVCETVTLQQPSICTKGAPGARVPDMAIGCKAYACEIVAKAQDDYGPEITTTQVGNWNTHFLANADNPTGKGGRAIICSGTPTDGTIKGWYPSPGVAAGATTKTATAVNPYGPHFPICKLNNVQGTCTKCVSWDSSDSVPVADDLTGTSGGILGSSGVAGYDGSSKRRLLADDASEDGEHAVEDGETVTL